MTKKRALRVDMHELHVEVDRHFLNYDEDDPYNY